MTGCPDGVTIPLAAGKPAVFRRANLAGKTHTAGCLIRQPLPDSDWHVTLFQVFYQASWKPGHATDTSTRPVESNSPPNKRDAISNIGIFSRSVVYYKPPIGLMQNHSRQSIKDRSSKPLDPPADKV